MDVATHFCLAIIISSRFFTGEGKGRAHSLSAPQGGMLIFKMRSERDFAVFSTSLKLCSFIAFKPGGGETHAGARFILRSLRNGFKLLFHLKFDFYIALRPGEGARALRFALDRLQ